MGRPHTFEQPSLPAQASGMVSPSFSELLTAAAQAERQLEEEGVLSLALPLGDPAAQQQLDPLTLLPRLGAGQRFRFLWDGAPGLCLAATGATNSLELSGPRRFELAQRFSAVSLSRLVSEPQGCPPLGRPRILLAFSFFDSPLQEGTGVPGVQAVLPRWQLSRQGRHCWLRLQRTLGGRSRPGRWRRSCGSRPGPSSNPTPAPGSSRPGSEVRASPAAPAGNLATARPCNGRWS